MFVPFGVALAGARISWPSAWLAGAALSAAVEYAQLFIPGRSTTVSDVCSNSVGALAGWMIFALVARAATRAARPSLGATAAASALFAAVVALTGVALRAAFPASTYFGQWTPDLGYIEWYRGRVLGADIAGMPLPSSRLPASARVRDLLATPGVAVTVLGIAGPRTRELASLFSIYDDREREVFLIGPDRDDLVLQIRTRASSWHLDQPDMRASGAITQVHEGDTLRVTARAVRDGYLLTVNRADFHVGFTPGQAWALVKYPPDLPAGLRTFLGAAWLTGLLLPVGFWGASRWGVVMGGGATLLVLAFVPRLVGLLATLPAEWVGAVGGLLLGLAAREALLRHAGDAGA